MAGDSLTVFHINTERTFRGGEVQTLLLAQELQKRGHHNVVIAQAHSPLAVKAKESGILTLELSMKGEWDLFAASAIRKAMLIHKPDLLHAHTAQACSLALLARWNHRRIPVVFSRRLHSAIHNKLKARNVDAVLAVSSSIRDLLIRTIPPERVFVAESATDFSILDQGVSPHEARERLNVPRDAFVVGNVNYFDKHKGQMQLVRAFLEFVRQKSRPCYLLLAGEGPLLEECRSLAQQSKFTNQILFTGRRSDLQNVYPAMDVFFFSSMPAALEGRPGVLREAMGTGIPCVATRLPATVEFIVHGETGLLVSHENPNEWVEAMDMLFNNQDLRSSFTEEGKRFARRFTPQNLADKTLDCYFEILGLRSGK